MRFFSTIQFIKPNKIPFSLAEISFDYPVGQPSGWIDTPDKLDTVHSLHAGIAVVKTVTISPKSGNPYPRIIRGNNYMINSLGLPNKGVNWWVGYFEKNKPERPLIISIKGDTLNEWSTLIDKLEPFTSIFELNFSCPNIDAGIMDLTEAQEIIKSIASFTNKPLILKLSPDYDPDQNIKLVQSVREHIVGVTLVNTVPTPNEKLGNPAKIGGKSGKEIYPILIEQLSKFREVYTTFNSLPILATGGIQPENIDEILFTFKAIPMTLTGFLTRSPYVYNRMNNRIHKLLTEQNRSLDDVLNN